MASSRDQMQVVDRLGTVLVDEAVAARARLIMAHGAGAAMDHPWMTTMVHLLVERGISVVRFEFGFMAARRTTGKRRPAPRADVLMPEFEAAIDTIKPAFDDGLTVLIGGKSLGGRVASLVADDLHARCLIDGLACFGYPFHPAGKPDRLRTEHLELLSCPALVIQGIRDPLGSHDEVRGYSLDPRIDLAWIEDGDHDLRPRKSSGRTFEQNLVAAAEAVVRLADAITDAPR